MQPTRMLHYRTQGFNGTAVKYSPFFDNRLAVASAANFGLVGNGRLYVLDLTEKGIVPVKWYVTSSLMACGWPRESTDFIFFFG